MEIKDDGSTEVLPCAPKLWKRVISVPAGVMLHVTTPPVVPSVPLGPHFVPPIVGIVRPHLAPKLGAGQITNQNRLRAAGSPSSFKKALRITWSTSCRHTTLFEERVVGDESR